MNTLDTELDNSIFEQILRKLSVEAFDALLEIGIRDAKGLLNLPVHLLRDNTHHSVHVVAELIASKEILSKYLAQRPEEMYKDTEDNKDLPQAKPRNTSSQKDHTSSETSIRNEQVSANIPDRVLHYGGKRTQFFLQWHKIYSNKDLFALTPDVMAKMPGIKSYMICEIQRMQNRLLDGSTDGFIPLSLFPWQLPSITKMLVSTKSASQNNEHQQGVLQSTFDELFSETFGSQHKLMSYQQSISIADLALDPRDLNLLRARTLYPEDDLTYLFALSIENLLCSGVSDDVLTKMLLHLSKACSDNNPVSLSVRLGKITTTPILAGLELGHIAALRLAGGQKYSSAVKYLPKGKYKSLNDLRSLSENSLVQSMGLVPQTLRAIYAIWDTRRQPAVLLGSQTDWLPESAYETYESLVNHTLAEMTYGDKERYLVKKRLGLLCSKKATLEEIASVLKITRSRVQQIESRSIRDFELAAKPKLGLLWFAVEVALEENGGVLLTTELASILAERWGWPQKPPYEALARLLSISSNLEISTSTYSLVRDPKNPCITCKHVTSALASLIDEAGGIFHIVELSMALIDFCRIEQSCPYVPVSFSEGFICYWIEERCDPILDNIIRQDKTIYTKSKWHISHGKTSYVIEAVLLNSQRAMHWAEIKKEVQNLRQGVENVSKTYLLNILHKLITVLPWGRGEFIHRCNAHIPIQLCRKIEEQVACWLADEVPYISVSGVYDNYRAELLDSGIHNDIALYTCLRELSPSMLQLCEYPYIMLEWPENARLPVDKVLERYILDRNDIVSLQELRNYAVNRLFINDTMLNYYIGKLRNVMRIDNGKYVHLSRVSLDFEQFSSIIEHMSALLSVHGHILVRKLFQDKRVTCIVLGISTPEMLYSFLQIHAGKEYNLRNFPVICRKDVYNNTPALVKEIVQYLLDKGEPCTRKSLCEHFVDKLGYDQRSVFSVKNQPEVVRYLDGTFVHVDTLEWSKEKQVDLETIAFRHLEERETIGEPYGLAKDIFDYEQLPILPTDINWTRTLLADLLSRQRHFRFLGPPRNAFISIPNRNSIETLSDLLWFVLKDEYGGAAELTDFVQEMIAAGILQNGLTRSMLGENSRVLINGNVVMVAEAMSTC